MAPSQRVQGWACPPSRSPRPPLGSDIGKMIRHWDDRRRFVGVTVEKARRRVVALSVAQSQGSARHWVAAARAIGALAAQPTSPSLGSSAIVRRVAWSVHASSSNESSSDATRRYSAAAARQRADVGAAHGSMCSGWCAPTAEVPSEFGAARSPLVPADLGAGIADEELGLAKNQSGSPSRKQVNYGNPRSGVWPG